MSDSTRLILRGGRVIDPASGTDAQLDVHIEGCLLYTSDAADE